MRNNSIFPDMDITNPISLAHLGPPRGVYNMRIVAIVAMLVKPTPNNSVIDSTRNNSKVNKTNQKHILLYKNLEKLRLQEGRIPLSPLN